ncbi:hypothetical protein KO504_16885 [Winogradskyella psychrotolerans]|uniref:hypothetical protein n=1 Tax=Winogradskyella psychrotolerans TaxID=1344585 RepID=UPI001C07D845|nr:hypothetical protein [Winogradskyella psychrotolerans]MBU2923027.1 hypothetical protein [Winogradskyella psychrotolerans]
MTQTIIIIALLLFFTGIAIIGFIAHFCFDDTDADLYWEDNYSTIDCPHLHITDVVEEAFANYELIGTYCMDCGERVSQRQDGF